MTDTSSKRSRTSLRLLEDQLAGISAWQRALDLREVAELARQESREARLEASRRLEALRRANSAVLARADGSITQTMDLLDRAHGRAVVAHRQDWVREKLALSLADEGLVVLAEVSDGAEALGITIAEQPELVIIEGRLPSLLAVDLVHDVRMFSPGTLVAAQVESDQEIAPLLDAGARAVFGRQVRPVELSQQVVALLRDKSDEVLLVT